MKIGNIELKWLGHAGFVIRNNKVIYIDPYNISEQENQKADFVLITHNHYDHCSIADIEKIVKDGSVVIMPADCQSKITKLSNRIEMQIIEPGDELSFGNIKIEAVNAYNIDKEFHPKSEGWLGFIVKIDNVVIYHAGDTDFIPEMEKLTGHGKQENEFIALLPVGGKFTMDAEEAAKAVSVIKPSLAIPMHYGSVIGGREDAEKFCNLCKEERIKCEVLEKE